MDELKNLRPVLCTVKFEIGNIADTEIQKTLNLVFGSGKGGDIKAFKVNGLYMASSPKLVIDYNLRVHTSLPSTNDYPIGIPYVSTTEATMEPAPSIFIVDRMNPIAFIDGRNLQYLNLKSIFFRLTTPSDLATRLLYLSLTIFVEDESKPVRPRRDLS